jgi:putative IMPACT (imprinted ancient) family translation regulator
MHTTLDYHLLGKVENELRSSVYDIKDIHYLDRVTIETFVEEGDKETFKKWMTELTNGQAAITEGDMLYLEKDIEL